MGERQRVVEEEERAKMAALAEQMSNESAQREGEVRRRHEAAMAKLALNREQQVTNPFAAPQPPASHYKAAFHSIIYTSSHLMPNTSAHRLDQQTKRLHHSCIAAVYGAQASGKLPPWAPSAFC